jgi:hypothetical protein
MVAADQTRRRISRVFLTSVVDDPGDVDSLGIDIRRRCKTRGWTQELISGALVDE